MDLGCFDRWTRRLAVGTSRRGALRGLIWGAAGAALAARRPAAAAAPCLAPGRRCHRRRLCCGTNGVPQPCGLVGPSCVACVPIGGTLPSPCDQGGIDYCCRYDTNPSAACRGADNTCCAFGGLPCQLDTDCCVYPAEVCQDGLCQAAAGVQATAGAAAVIAVPGP